MIDDEEDAASSSSNPVNDRRVSIGKRKRETRESAREVVELDDDELGESGLTVTSGTKKRRTTRSSNDQNNGEGNVIVIEDD